MPKGQKDLELHQKFLELNDKYFDNFLSKNLIVSKSKRLTRRAGSCYFYVYPNGVVRPLEICVSEKYIEKYPFDFVIGSMHLIHGEDPYFGKIYEEMGDEEAYREYFRATLENLKRAPKIHTLGHLDYAVRYGKEKDRYYIYIRFL